jgi:hypothetical protein
MRGKADVPLNSSTALREGAGWREAENVRARKVR